MAGAPSMLVMNITGSGLNMLNGALRMLIETLMLNITALGLNILNDAPRLLIETLL